jgi:hypothetical protein
VRTFGGDVIRIWRGGRGPHKRDAASAAQNRRPFHALRGMKWLRDNGLTLALLALFAVSVIGQGWAGWLSAAEEMRAHSASAPTLVGYLGSAEFLSALFENWESEFLQMAVYVVLTAHLFQRGSAESRDPDKKQPERPNDQPPPKGDWGARLYAHSLGLTLAALFLASFVLHWIYSAQHAAENARRHGETPMTLAAHLGDAQFWFESFQNWQSEFLSVAVIVVLSIFLREQGSPESKAVGASNSETGA